MISSVLRMMLHDCHDTHRRHSEKPLSLSSRDVYPHMQSGDGLDYDPKTLVSYTVYGGIGYDRPEVLLQAVVYARGDGPACVMPPLDDEEDPGEFDRR